MDKVKKRNWSLVFIIIVVFMFFANPITQVRAEVNKTYGDKQTGVGSYDDPTSVDDDAGIVGLLSIAILQIGHLLEGIVAWLMGLLTGNVSDAQFPWADQIIFNTLPILDVNFIHPADGSLFSLKAGTGVIGDVIRNIYFTGMSIAVGFLSIIVGVMSVRMAITTIASTKATYKESIVNLLTTLVLVFGLHFMLSGMFYLNEKLVEVASTIVTNLVKEEGGSEGSSNTPTSISGMGTYFYDTAIDQGGTTKLILWDIPAAAPIPTVLYLLFIGQSLVFLIAYFKRFFYVVILAVIGPFVVIYDFLKKAIS